jgi:hypothetical protein
VDTTDVIPSIKPEGRLLVVLDDSDQPTSLNLNILFNGQDLEGMKEVLVFTMIVFAVMHSCHGWLVGPMSSTIGRFRMNAKVNALSTGDLENVAIARIDSLGDTSFGKFKIDGKVAKKEMNGFIYEYKEEMKRKNVIIPGFRPGKVPPHAMPEIREFVVSHALETLLGELCNVNGLMVSCCLSTQRCTAHHRQRMCLLLSLISHGFLLQPDMRRREERHGSRR